MWFETKLFFSFQKFSTEFSLSARIHSAKSLTGQTISVVRLKQRRGKSWLPPLCLNKSDTQRHSRLMNMVGEPDNHYNQMGGGRKGGDEGADASDVWRDRTCFNSFQLYFQIYSHSIIVNVRNEEPMIPLYSRSFSPLTILFSIHSLILICFFLYSFLFWIWCDKSKISCGGQHSGRARVNDGRKQQNGTRHRGSE